MGVTRMEHDLLGTKEIPADVYWGVHTARAVENFQITGVTIGHNPYLVRGLAYVKEAAALANHELGLLDQSGWKQSSGPAAKFVRVRFTSSSSWMKFRAVLALPPT